ncbi:polysaccharide lyase 8 family protein [Stackebrandtia nassauensis]|uniref:Hyaluronate lyase n=1 Tax=Stackebrandtia nassauensis (strain DSM 44728 / CIP 108903 / NRRL B-16338 / NBRC 102104 / LLR-40K-21) TaxID=446470 RepID=D3Q856_STANL|nr:polysaccharide lyase 8 family protein [Stackebrandtia nassauensis]ADD40561.1 Hyaluronate lyase [Stackebrandtia nassauensis DSM 44728]
MPRRRSVLSLAAAIAVTGPVLLGAKGAFAADDDYAAALERWRGLLTGGGDYDPADEKLAAAIGRVDATAKRYRDGFIRDGGRTTLWEDLPGTDAQTANTMLTRLQAMANAYGTKGSAYEGNAGYREDIVDGLSWIYDNRYHEGLPEQGNWWHWEIGMPMAVASTVPLLRDGIPAELTGKLMRAVAHFVPDPTYRTNNPSIEETGANRTDKVLVTAVRGLLSRDAAVLAMGRDALSQVFDYVDSGDGFYRDGSFVQHTYFAYTGSYGNVLIGSMAKSLAVLAGSPWDVTDADRVNVYAWLREAFAPVVFRGQYLAHVRGRSIARKASDDHDLARGLIASAAYLHPAAGTEDGKWIGETLAGWIEADDFKPFEDHAGVPSIVATRKAVAGATAAGDAVFHKQFAAMDRMVHAREGYVFTVSARGNRIAAYESGNGENLYGFYTGEGMTYLYTGDLAQYSDGFWPTVDPYRLAGTTVATEATYPRSATDTGFGAHLGPNKWVGGSSLGDGLGAYGMAFTAQTDPGTEAPIDLKGKKSWFTVGDVVVALGSDITASEVAAQTTVENRRVPDGGTTITVDGEGVDSDGWDASLSGVGWLSVPGAGGYVFTGSTEGLRGLGDRRTGRWSDIGADPEGGEGDEVTRDFATVWFDHGAAPSAASYEYTVLPGADAEATAAYAADPSVTVTDNSADVHAVRGARGRRAANFWNPGTADGVITVDQPSSVVMVEDGGEIAVAVSDPKQSGVVVTVVVARATSAVIEADENVKVSMDGAKTTITVDTRGRAGLPSTARLSAST